jgi:hypothetical protein
VVVVPGGGVGGRKCNSNVSQSMCVYVCECVGL